MLRNGGMTPHGRKQQIQTKQNLATLLSMDLDGGMAMAMFVLLKLLRRITLYVLAEMKFLMELQLNQSLISKLRKLKGQAMP